MALSQKVVLSKFKIEVEWFQHTLGMTSAKTFSSAVISARLRKLEQRYDALRQQYENLLVLITDESNISVFSEQYKQAEEIYNQLDVIKAGLPDSGGAYQPSETSTKSQLPRINLEIFEGELDAWSSFISLYNSLVLARTDLSKTEKYHHLVSNVRKEPKLLIQHLPMVDESLDTAMTILKSRYENKRLLADNHISRILHLQTLKSPGGLRMKILNPLLQSTRALTNLGFPVEQWSYLLLHVSLTKIPIEIKTRFEREHGNSSNLPTFQQLIDFLTMECRIQESTVEDTGFDSHVERSRKAMYVAIPTVDKQCGYCNRSGHLMCDCFKFERLNNYERKEWVKGHGLCFRCFGNHSAASCTFNVPCVRCGNSGHNKLICSYTVRSASPTEGTPQNDQARGNEQRLVESAQWTSLNRGQRSGRGSHGGGGGSGDFGPGTPGFSQ